ncbi:MAG: transcriptional repressor [Chloroflexi bacterium]|nr:transcriptional repressor [Chloroflexota bacterium]
MKDIEKTAALALRETGRHLTRQRRLIVEALSSSEGHFTAEEIYDSVRSRLPRLNVSTVYRTLEALKKLGLVNETDLGGGRLSYHLAEKGHHHHLICQGCGQVSEMDEAVLEPLKRALGRKHGFRADLRHLAIFGWCSRCSRKDQAA